MTIEQLIQQLQVGWLFMQGNAFMQRSDQELTNSPSADIRDSDTHTRPLLQATLCIERALHLTLPPSVTAAAPAASVIAAARPGNEGQVAVAFEWEGVPHTTPAVLLSHGGSATWQYDTPLDVAQAVASCGRRLEPAPLRLQVSSPTLCTKHSSKEIHHTKDGELL